MQREELKFINTLRKKEETVRLYLDQQMKKNESEHALVMKLTQMKFKSLETHLKKLLSGVEGKEREMKRKVENNNAQLAQKIAELDLEQKLVQKESHHIIDMEVCK